MVEEFKCRRCIERDSARASEEGKTGQQGIYERLNGMKQMGLELVNQLCYLRNVIEAEGGVDGAVMARIRRA